MVAARNIIDALHALFREKPEAERPRNTSPETLNRAIKKVETQRSSATSDERCGVFTLFYRQTKEDNHQARRFAKKLEGHRKLVHYEQRAVNQIRKAARIKK